jgi:hypothetical protein
VNDISHSIVGRQLGIYKYIELHNYLIFAENKLYRLSFYKVPLIEHNHTDKKENKIFLIYMEIQKELGAKSYYMTYTASLYIVKFRKPFLIYDFAPDPV